MHEAILSELAATISGKFSCDTELAPMVRWKIGGRAKALVEPANARDVAAVFQLARKFGVPVFIMGDASNLLFDSRGFDGIIMRIGRRMSQIAVDENRIRAEAGIWMPQLARFAGGLGLSGIEHTIGIPGTFGGLVLMNGGSQRKGVGLNVVEVECVDYDGKTIYFDNAACGFSYRTSNIQNRQCAIIAATLELEPASPNKIRREMIDIMTSRRSRFPKNLPNGGSTFLSDPALYATMGPPGSVIEKLGLKGRRYGAAQISPQHANFIVNLGSASSDDVLALIHLIRKEAHAKTGFLMNCEVRFVSKCGKVEPAHVASEERFGPIY